MRPLLVLRRRRGTFFLNRTCMTFVRMVRLSSGHVKVIMSVFVWILELLRVGMMMKIFRTVVNVMITTVALTSVIGLVGA